MVATDIADQPQRQAALNPLMSFCVTAPAGSGKTELLIQRFLTLLARVSMPEEVLAITFTRKAAAEMRERIIAALESASLTEPVDTHRRLTWRLARGALDNSSDRGWNLLATPGRLNIKTIDSYCATLTRQMPVLSGFGANLAAVDDARPYYLQATRAMLELLESDHPVATDLATIMLHFYNDWARLEKLLVSMLARREQWLAYIGVSLESASADKSLQDTVRALVQDSLGSISENLGHSREQIMECLAYSRSNLQLPVIQHFPDATQEQMEDWRSIVDLLLTNTGTWRKQVTVKQGFPPGAGADKALANARKEQLKSLIQELQQQDQLLDALNSIRHLPDINDDPEQWQTLLSLCRVLPVLAAQLSVVFQQHGVVDHSQVAMAAREALGDDESPTVLAEKLDYTLRHILLDEFQDTAINQFELVRRLTRGWSEDNQANPENPNTLFIVGDGMQSIYGFRDADVGLFIKAKQQGFNGVALQALDLHSNFRSDAPLVNWVNQAFGQAFPASDNLQRGEIAFTASSAQRPATVRSPVELLAFTGDDDIARAAEAEHLASVIASGLGDPDCNSIAVLVRTRNQLAPIIRALKARDIPWQAQDIDPLANSSVVIDLQTLCQALHQIADDVAWLALLRAPWSGMSLADLLLLTADRGEQSVWERMQDSALRETLSKEGSTRLVQLNSVLRQTLARRERRSLRNWIEQAWLQLGGPATARRPEQLADANAFFQLLENMDAQGETYLPSLMAERIGKLYSRDSDTESKVKLLTLHKSKGLEFDWVIIPALERAPAVDSRDLLTWNEYHGTDGSVGFLLAMDDQGGREERSLYNYLNQVRKRKRLLEATRLLYVGCTRASKRLFLSASLVQEEDAWKPPSTRSLLHCIWPVFETECELLSPELPVPAQELPEAGLRRLVTLPPLQADTTASQPEPAAGNVPMRPQNLLQRHVGTVIHLSLQRLSAFTEEELGQLHLGDYRSWWRRQLLALGPGTSSLDEACERVEASVRRVLSDEHGRWLLSREREGAHSEYALSCLLPDGRLAEYIIDRTYIDKDIRWIVDYKSSMPEDGEPLGEFLQREQLRYLPQLQHYAQVFAGLERRQVKTALYFTCMAHWLECE
jgi:ATP-dependent helicase/nuclease subunit A